MKKETMKATVDGYIYKGVTIRKSYYAREVIWHADGKVFPTLREAKKYIDSVKE